MLECKILTSEAEVAALADEWRQLHAHVGRSLYSDYDLFEIWWRLLGKTNNARQLHIVTGRENGRLVALLPLTVVSRKGVRIMQAAGNGAYAFDTLAENDEQSAEIWRTARCSPHYDFASLRDVYPDMQCHAALLSFAKRRDVSEAYRLRLTWPTSADWIKSMPSRINHDPQRRLRRLAEKGEVRFEIYQGQTPPRAIIEEMVKRKKDWVIERQKHGFFEHPNIMAYFVEITEWAARSGRLFLSWLSCGDSIIAYDQGFIFKGELRNFTITHDPAWSHYSPGILILRNSIAWAIDNGIHTFHNGMGYGNYKANYTNDIQYCDEFMFSRALKGQLLESAFYSMRAMSRFAKERRQLLRKKA